MIKAKFENVVILSGAGLSRESGLIPFATLMAYGLR
jgi:NAD-dependent SIR2 family protein deacetylase